jgi:uridine phosphorylase
MIPEPIAPSELILTPRGTIYHLDLHPDQLAETIITVGDPERVASVSRYFDSIESTAQHREFVTHTGRIGSKRLSVVSTGIGPDNIDIVLNELDALANIDFDTRTIKTDKKRLNIIRLGTCGGLQKGISVDSLVASSFGLGLDNLLHYYAYAPNPEERFIQQEFQAHLGLSGTALHPYVVEGAIRLRNLFSAIAHSGMTATCPGFYGPQGRMLRLAPAHPQLINAISSFECRGERVANFEMETAAIYGLAHLLGHHALSVSVVVAQRAEGTFTRDGAAAVDAMIRKCLPLLEAL